MAPKFEDIWYTRPKLRKSPSIRSANSSQYSGLSSNSGIPDGLQLQLVLDGRTCPPCSVRDFNVLFPYGIHSNCRNIWSAWSTHPKISHSTFGLKVCSHLHIRTNE